MRNFLIDAILFALFVAEMSFHFLPKILHEILGVAMAAAIFIHFFINRRRFVSLTKKITPSKIFSTLINIFLTICAGIIFITGVCMSNYLFADFVSFELRRNMTIHQLHVSTPYIMLILIGIHIGLHWRELWQRFLNLIGAEEFYQRRKNFFKVAAIILSAIGVAGLYLNHVGDRILMKHIFATPATDLPAVIFILLIIGGVGLFALITFIVDKKIKGRD